MSTEAEVIDAARSFLGDGFGGHDVRAVEDRNTGIWSVGIVDSNGMVEAGAVILVGPDKRVWSFSSNPSIHDRELAMTVLSELYRRGVADSVESQVLACRIAELTSLRREHSDDLIKAAEAGELRTVTKRTLP